MRNNKTLAHKPEESERVMIGIASHIILNPLSPILSSEVNCMANWLLDEVTTASIPASAQNMPENIKIDDLMLFQNSITSSVASAIISYNIFFYRKKIINKILYENQPLCLNCS